MSKEWTEEKKDEMIDFQDFIDLFMLKIKKGLYRPVLANDNSKKEVR